MNDGLAECAQFPAHCMIANRFQNSIFLKRQTRFRANTFPKTKNRRNFERQTRYIASRITGMAGRICTALRLPPVSYIIRLDQHD